MGPSSRRFAIYTDRSQGTNLPGTSAAAASIPIKDNVASNSLRLAQGREVSSSTGLRATSLTTRNLRPSPSSLFPLNRRAISRAEA